jgi:hypothetical protein
LEFDWDVFATINILLDSRPNKHLSIFLRCHLPSIRTVIFGSIVVSISACHLKEQLAGGRGSIPRQRDVFFLLFGRDFLFLLPGCTFLIMDVRDFAGRGWQYPIWNRLSAKRRPSANTRPPSTRGPTAYATEIHFACIPLLFLLQCKMSALVVVGSATFFRGPVEVWQSR